MSAESRKDVRRAAAGCLLAASLWSTALVPASATAATAATGSTPTPTAALAETTPTVGSFPTSFRPEADDEARALVDPHDGYLVVAGVAGGDFGLTLLNLSSAVGDNSFGGDSLVTTDFGGRRDAANAVALAPGRNIVAAGSSDGDVAVARYADDGSLDRTFGTAGKVLTDLGGADDAAYAVSASPDGKLVVAGGTGATLGVLRYNPDGTLDPTFGANGRLLIPSAGPARALVTQPDGQIVVAGGGGGGIAVARLTTDGTLDPAFGSGDVARIGPAGSAAGALALLPDGRLVVAGGMGGDAVVARLLPSGAPDPAFGTGGIAPAVDFGRSDTASGVSVDSDGRVRVVGQATDGSGYYATYLPTGLLDTTFGTGGYKRTDVGLRAVVPALGGTWYVAGGRRASYDDDDFFVSRFYSDGTLWGGLLSVRDFGSPSQKVRAAVHLPDGRTLLAGETGGSIGLVRHLPDGSRDPTFGLAGRVESDLAQFPTAAAVEAGGRAVVVGQVGVDLAVVGFRADGSVDPTFGDAGRTLTDLRTYGVGSAILVLPDGKLLVGGTTSESSFLARYTADGQADASFGTGGILFDTLGTGWGPPTTLLRQPDGRILATGAGGVRRVNADGTTDTGFGTGGLATFPSWELRAPAALALLPDGRIVVGGQSPTDSYGYAGFAIVRLNPNGTRDTSWPVVNTLFAGGNHFPRIDPVVSIFPAADGTLLAAGGGAVARYRPDSTLDPTFGTGGRLLLATELDRAVTVFLVDGHLVSAGEAGSPALPAFLLVVNRLPLPGLFHPVTPSRILDTRAGNGAPVAKVGQGVTLPLQVTGRGGVPAVGVTAVALNVTATEPTTGGFVTAWPAGQVQPIASNLNFAAGRTVANLVVVGVGANGVVNLFNPAGTVHLVVDVAGWYGGRLDVSGQRIHALPPSRILDTREGYGAPAAKVVGGGVVSLQVTGRGGVPASGVGAVVMNLTVTEPTSGGFVTAWPAGQAFPDASSLNMAAGETRANLVMVPVGDGGRVYLYNRVGSVHLVADIAGWYADGGDRTGQPLHPVAPSRILDTREGNGAPPARVGPGATLALQVTGRGGVPPTGVSAVVMNVTATEPTAGGFVTAWPAGAPRPNASNLNFAAGDTVPNLVVVPVGPGGVVDLYNRAGSTHLLADVAGWFG